MTDFVNFIPAHHNWFTGWLVGWAVEQDDGCKEEHLSAGDWGVPTEEGSRSEVQEGSHSDVQEGTGGDQVVRSTDPLHLALNQNNYITLLIYKVGVLVGVVTKLFTLLLDLPV